LADIAAADISYFRQFLFISFAFHLFLAYFIRRLPILDIDFRRLSPFSLPPELITTTPFSHFRRH
jgi:hypothetical protein